ncbi:MAG: response regulator transcription factor [Gemmatimonadaceae bacterium]
MQLDLIRVVIADDHTVVRAGLKAVLRTAPDILVVGEAANGREVIAVATRERPDVIVMDLAMPELDGIDATKAIVAAELPSRVLMLSMHTEEECLVPVMEAGASGYLVKADAHRDLVDAIRVVAHGDCFVRPSAARILAKKLSAIDPVADDRRRFEALTPRERAVLRFVALGFTSAEVGQRVFISAKVVDAHKQRIRTLLHLTHRSHYVQFALRLGLLNDVHATPTQ